jgi:hypothetical protein
VTEQIEREEVVVRRAPKFGAFMFVGAALAVIGTLIATSLFPVDPKIGFAALFGYFCVYTVPTGVLVGALVALGFDRRSRKRTAAATAERETIESAELPGVESAEAAEIAETPGSSAS